MQFSTTNGKRRRLAVEDNSGWTAHFALHACEGQNGYLAFSAVCY
jgi:hypothetical protein